jgi:succinate-semialdehyde dehydrogenase/glutarate-semialdehyde dehydrogenase
MGALTVGHGLTGADVGPLIDRKARDDVAALVDGAIAGGARALTGVGPVGDVGYFYKPTVLVDIPRTAAILRTEIFGPVAPVQAFDTQEEAVTAANASESGLTAYLYTRDLSRALSVVDQLDTGMVGVNRGLVSNPAAPFGGVKASGMGREGGPEGIDEYLAIKYASIAL